MGSTAPGFDADIMLCDAGRKETIRQEILHHGSDYSPYQGIEITGWPVMTLMRRKVVCEEGRSLDHRAMAGFSCASSRPPPFHRFAVAKNRRAAEFLISACR
jgi:hypothetical protein